jgi:hypothetical protein
VHVAVYRQREATLLHISRQEKTQHRRGAPPLRFSEAPANYFKRKSDWFAAQYNDTQAPARAIYDIYYEAVRRRLE